MEFAWQKKATWRKCLIKNGAKKPHESTE